MSVYIKGMEMPANCGECPFMVKEPEEAPWCGRANYTICDGFVDPDSKPGWCNLFPVPDHGRLIDADALLEHMKKVHDKWKMGEHYTPTTDDEIMVMYMPTIIPADKEVDE